MWYYIEKESLKVVPIQEPESGESDQEFVAKICKMLCKDEILFHSTDWKCYCHIELAQFISDMNKVYKFNIDKMYQMFERQLSECLLEKIKSMNNYF